MELRSFSHKVWILLFYLFFFLTCVHILIVTDTHVIWGLNLGQNNLTAAFLEAQSLVKAFASPPIKDAGIVLEAIEIGNEADLYSNNGARPRTFTSTQYVTECVPTSRSGHQLGVTSDFLLTQRHSARWIAFASNVSTAVQLAASSLTQFWGGSFAGSSHSTSGFSPQAIFQEGILSSAPGSLISTYAYFLTQTYCVFMLIDSLRCTGFHSTVTVDPFAQEVLDFSKI